MPSACPALSTSPTTPLDRARANLHAAHRAAALISDDGPWTPEDARRWDALGAAMREHAQREAEDLAMRWRLAMSRHLRRLPAACLLGPLHDVWIVINADTDLRPLEIDLIRHGVDWYTRTRWIDATGRIYARRIPRRLRAQCREEQSYRTPAHQIATVLRLADEHGLTVATH